MALNQSWLSEASLQNQKTRPLHTLETVVYSQLCTIDV
jgi:hypothetical protein